MANNPPNNFDPQEINQGYGNSQNFSNNNQSHPVGDPRTDQNPPQQMQPNPNYQSDQRINKGYNQQPNNYYQNVQQQVSQNPYFQVHEPVQPQQPQQTLKSIIKPNKQPFLPFDALGDFLIRRWWLVLIISILIALITVSLYTFVLRQEKPGSDFTNVEASIEGPKTLPSGSPGVWKIQIQNRESVSINQIEVKLNFDKSFKYFKKINPDPTDIAGKSYKLANLQAVGQGTSDAIISFEGLLNGNIDEDTLMSGEISYVPTPLLNKQNSRITVPILSQNTLITAPEIKAELSMSKPIIQSGNEVEITLKFQNFSEKELSDLRIKLSYPDKSFVYSSSDLTLTSSTSVKLKPDDGNNIWYITTLPRLQTQILKVRGIINGAEGVKQTFTSEIGIKNGSDYNVLQTIPADVTITAQPLFLTTSIDNKGQNPYFAPDENLNFIVTYQNKSNQTLNNIEVFASLDDPSDLIDYTTLKYEDGIVSNRIIQWRSSGVKQLESLAPQGKGTLKFSAKVKGESQFIKSGLSQNAYTIKMIAEGKALNLPQTRFEGFAYKAEGSLTAKQEVKQVVDTTLPSTQRLYEVTWSIKTAQNRINDIIITSSTNLDPSSWNQASIKPAIMSNKISYNPLNGSIIWKPGNVEGYAGVSNPTVSVSFRLLVDVTTGGSFSGSQLLKPASGQGSDDVTSKKYDLKFEEYKILN
jgi:hypothetical protein